MYRCTAVQSRAIDREFKESAMLSRASGKMGQLLLSCSGACACSGAFLLCLHPYDFIDRQLEYPAREYRPSIAGARKERQFLGRLVDRTTARTAPVLRDALPRRRRPRAAVLPHGCHRLPHGPCSAEE
eukprot:COSAG01_NODE_164_length_23340_cov_76.030033_13_plen_128_part_00